MLIKGFRILWIKIRVKNRRFIRIPFPIPLYIFEELLDCFLDILNVVYFFVPKVSKANSFSQFNVYSVKTLVIMVMKMLESLTGEESYELVEVTTDKVEVLIKIW